MTLQPIPSEFPCIWGKFSFLFYQWSSHLMLNWDLTSEVSVLILILVSSIHIRNNTKINKYFAQNSKTSFAELSSNLILWLNTKPRPNSGTKSRESNEKRGGLKVKAFDRSPLKLFTLRFSSKSVQAPSCVKPKITERTLFLSFEINNCLPIITV